MIAYSTPVQLMTWDDLPADIKGKIMMTREYNRFVRVCPLLERLDELLSVAREHATQSIKAFVHHPKNVHQPVPYC